MKKSDSLGDIEVPDDVLYGAQTQRAVNNFKISDLKVDKDLLESYLILKKAAAMTNYTLSFLSEEKYLGITKAIDYILQNFNYRDFPVDIYQAGAGTSTNMNINEVISNIAQKIYRIEVHPNDDVNKSQSTNDTYPTALRIAIVKKYKTLELNMDKLIDSFQNLEKKYANTFKVGRTHLEDAAPLTFSQEFSGYKNILKTDLERIKNVMTAIKRLNIGGTAVGNEINAPANYKKLVVQNINSLLGSDFQNAENLFEVMQSMSDFSQYSKMLSVLAEDLIKISNDLRLLNSGPLAGINEIILPPVQPGSSIMPGKINPSIAEAMNMICYKVLGNDHTVSIANQAGQLELNVMMPIISYSILDSMNIITNGIKMFNEKLVSDLIVNEKRVAELLNKSNVTAILFAPYLGYETVAKLVKEADQNSDKIENLIVKKKLLKKEQVTEIIKKYKS
ncbi:MAG: aspartate ammonia-lyase [Thermoplasmata archaeon]